MTTKAIILAAGRGSRMKHLTDKKPKCLIQFRGRSLLAWQISALERAGVSDVAVVTGYMRDAIPLNGLTEFRNDRWSTTNMVTSLECADEWLSQEHCIVSYSDIYYSESSIKPLMSDTSPIAITYDPMWLGQWERRFANPLEDAESFVLDKNHKVQSIGGKAERVSEIKGQYMGILGFRPEGWSRFRRMRAEMEYVDKDHMHLTGALSRLVSMGYSEVQAIPVDDEWLELDTEADIQILE